MAVFTTLMVILMVLQFPVRSLESDQCSADYGAKIRFSVSSRRNETGHRLIGVRILNDDVYGSVVDAASEQTVDVEHVTMWCKNSEVTITTAHAEAPPIVRFRRPDYELIPELGYYKLHTEAQTWEKAKLTCLKEGTHLLVVNSEREAKIWKQLYDRKLSIQGATWTDHIFVGISDRAVEGEYVTVLGEPLNSTGYTKWQSGEPDNTAWCNEPESDCVVMYTDGTLLTVGCLCKTAFVCEKEL